MIFNKIQLFFKKIKKKLSFSIDSNKKIRTFAITKHDGLFV